MKYTIDISINMPRERVIELFDNPDNLSKWQLGLKSFTQLEGKAGQEGSSSRMVFTGRKSDLVITETVKRRNFPDLYCVDYKSKGVYNEVINHFSEPEPGQTIWKMINVFKFSGIMALMAPFMKSAFTSNTLLNMERFKAFAEKAPQKEAEQK